MTPAIILIGLAAAAAVYYTGTRGRLPDVPLPDGAWVVPIPRYKDGRKPVISDGFGDQRPPPENFHHGSDLMYTAVASDAWPKGSEWRSKGGGFVMPPMVPVFAARDGVLWSAGYAPTGWSVVIDHGKPYSTYYTHLERLAIEERAAGAGGRAVKAGELLGWVGYSPKDGERLRHLHFEVWFNGAHESAIDPSAIIAAATTLPWREVN